MGANLRIGEILTERGYVNEQQMEEALAYQKGHRDRRVGQILIELQFVTEQQVLEALASRLDLEIVDVSLQTETSYGDYGMKITKKGTSEVPDFLNDAKVYGVVIGTDTNGYGLRHLENIWRKYDLAWCTGFTTKVHNGPTSSEHYNGADHTESHLLYRQGHL